MVKRMPTGAWWNQLSPDKRRKVILTINETAELNFSESFMHENWSHIYPLLRSQIEIYREVDADMKFAERHQGLKQVSNKHW